MIYLDLFIGFLKVGLFSFGGAYSAIPLIRDVALSYGWLDEEMLSYIIAVSESTPGPIMVNLATYVGSIKGGLLGSVIATLAVILPAFIIILLIAMVLKSIIKNKYVQAVLDGLKPCIIAIILSIGCVMMFNNLVTFSPEISVDYRALIIAVLLGAVFWGLNKKLKISPIALISISAVLGAIAYAI